MDEFTEIGHSGGVLTFSFSGNSDGSLSIQVAIRSSRPVPMVWTSLWALPVGIPVSTLRISGMGEQPDPPPFPGCLPVYIQSDSQGKFGHHCPRCEGYWRSGPWPAVCPYCALHADGHNFLSKAQLKYVDLYCALLSKAAENGEITNAKIDMDAVADAVGTAVEKPAFYISEVSQQTQFKCVSCDEFNDILGKFGYCSRCGTRNDLRLFENDTIPAIRNQLNAGMRPEDCLKDAVGSFDSYVSQYAKQLAANVALMPDRKMRLRRQAFHDLKEVREIFDAWFGIDLCKGMKDSECASVARLFFRRHLYEHNGGEVDQKYLDASGDTTVILKQAIKEAKEAIHDFLGSLLKMANNLHVGFHLLLPPEQVPIEAFSTKKQRINGRQTTD